jgi:small-conductance mechanosensitive channel
MLSAGGCSVDLPDLPLLNADTTRKLLLSLAVLAAVALVRIALFAGARLLSRSEHPARSLFRFRQALSLTGLLVTVLCLLPIWFNDPTRLSTVVGIATAGIAVASQKPITAFAGYLIIIRGKTFTVGDRIKIGGVQGDVIELGFLQTRILEMGQPPEVNAQEQPGMWVRDRQFTGRIVTVTNDKVFDESVFNFTREFPFLWEELHVPVAYRANRDEAERILLDAARVAMSESAQAAEAARERLQRKYGVVLERHDPRVFWHLTDNWIEMTVRFVAPDHATREIKDRVSRELLRGFEAAGIEVAGESLEINVSSVPRLRFDPPRVSTNEQVQR